MVKVRMGIGSSLVLPLCGCFGTYAPLSSDGSTSTSESTTDATDTTSTGPEPEVTSTASSTVEPTTSSGSTDDVSTTTSVNDCDCPDELDALIVFDTALAGQEFELGLAIIQLFDILPQIFGGFCGFHVGFTSTAGVPSNPKGCQQPGALLQPSGLACDAFKGQAYIDKIPALETVVSCFVQGGLLTPSAEPHQPVNTILRALSPDMNDPGGCNEGFFRPEVPLYIVVFSAEDDTVTAGDTTTWAFQIRQLNTGVGATAPSPWGFTLFGGAEVGAGETSGGQTSGDASTSSGGTGDAPRMCPLPPPEKLLELTLAVPPANRFLVDVCADPDALGEAFVQTFEVAKSVCQ